MKTNFLSKVTGLAAGILLLQTVSAFSAYHPSYLDQADPAGNIGTYVSVTPGTSGFVISSDQPGAGTPHYSNYYQNNEAGSWRLASPTSVTVHADAVFSGLTLENLTGFSFGLKSAGPADLWTLTITTSSGDVTTSFTGDAGTGLGSNWFTVTSASIYISYEYGGSSGNWAAVRTNWGSAIVTDITLFGSAGSKLANLEMTQTIAGGETLLVKKEVVVFTSAVPEPGSIAMLIGGAGALFLMGRRRMLNRRG